MKIISNDNDFILKEVLRTEMKKADTLKIAVAFLSDSSLIEEAITMNKKCQIIVCLLPPTNPKALERIFDYTSIRYFGSNFHPKLYIFEKNNKVQSIILGSSNLSENGIKFNKEINILIPANGTKVYICRKLKNKFNHWFNKEANILDPIELDNFKKIYQHWKKAIITANKISKKFSNRGKKSVGKISVRDYSENIRKIGILVNFYKKLGIRKSKVLPPYAEIDQFLNYLKIEYGRQYTKKKVQSIRIPNTPKELQTRIRHYAKEYINSDFDVSWLEEKLGKSRVLLSKRKLYRPKGLTKHQVEKVLENINSVVYGINTNFGNGGPTYILRKNKLKKINKSWKYLIWGDTQDLIQKRISNCIKSKSEYKLNGFGESSVTEILGWARPKEFPFYNERVAWGVRFLGIK